MTSTTQTAEPVTAAEIRASFKAQGREVRISRDGRVTYRSDNGAWLEGRFVEEYVREDGQVHLR